MTLIDTRVIVAADGTVSLADPLPPGEYPALLSLDGPAPASTRRSVRDMVIHHGPWDDSLSLRREDMYGDDGR